MNIGIIQNIPIFDFIVPNLTILEVILFDLLLIIIGFVLLIKGADYLIEGASSLAKKFNISEFAIGLTIVAMGTSMPELVVNIISGINDHDGVVFGNVIGSNIFNLLLILGIAGAIHPLVVKSNTVWVEIPFSLGITLLLIVLINDSYFFGSATDAAGRIDGIILISLFVVFLVYVVVALRKNKDMIEEMNDIMILPTWKTTVFLVGGIIGLAIGGNMVVTNAVDVATHFNLSQKFIGLTIIAAGTSLPELATTAVAAYKRRADIAVGNIIGSNIFNFLLVLGLTAVISPLNYDNALNADLLILFIGTSLLFVFMFTLGQKKLDRWESILYLLSFAAYMVYLFIRE